MPSIPLSPTLAAALATFGRHGLQTNTPLAPHTTFRIGGPAAALLTIDKLADLVGAMDLLYESRVPFLLLGGGSNVLISDAGIPGVVLLNQCRHIQWTPNAGDPHLVQVESGVALAGFARSAIKRGFAGLAWAVSVPGTVGGAVIGNAGAHGGCIADNLHSVSVWQEGVVETRPAETLAYGYRHSALKSKTSQPGFGPIVLTAAFRLHPDPTGEEAQRAATFIAHRRRTQPTAKSAGSIFKNPPHDFAGRLIEAAGLKGTTVGGASVSDRHANFIINHGDATASDVIHLINLIRCRVYEHAGVVLQPEILFLGDWSAGPTLEPLTLPPIPSTHVS